MSKSLFAVLLASTVILPLAAHADPIDNFVLTGGGNTISYSLPATLTTTDYPLFGSISASAPTTINGVSGYNVTSTYYYSVDDLSMSLDFPPTVFGGSTLELFNDPFFINWAFPLPSEPYLPAQVFATFVPGTYTLQTEFPDSNYPVDYTLTINQQTAVTPEPSSLILFATAALSFLLLFLQKRALRTK